MATNASEQQGWQVGKSLTTCLLHMLESEVVCDVTFDIQSTGGGHNKVSAHKMILQARSPVFEAMFTGPFVEAGEAVVVTDVDYDVFRTMLKYLYTDDVTLTGDNVLHLLHAATKYTLKDLSDKCQQYLAQQITVQNACSILTHSLVYQVEKLVNSCMDLIAPNVRTAAKSEAFYNMSHDALLKVLGNDQLALGAEADLFEGCLEWGKRKVKDKKNPTDREIRDRLGDCINKIRFPFIDVTEFAQKFDSTSVLTPEEHKDILMLLLTKREAHSNALASKGFDVTSRMIRLQRYSTVHSTTYGIAVSGQVEEEFTLSVNNPIKLMGFSVYGGPAGSEHQVKVTIENTTGGVDPYVIESKITSKGDGQPISVLVRKMNIEANVAHRVRVSVKGPESVGYGTNFQQNHNIENTALSSTTSAFPCTYVVAANDIFNGEFYMGTEPATNEFRGYVAEMLFQRYNYQ